MGTKLCGTSKTIIADNRVWVHNCCNKLLNTKWLELMDLWTNTAKDVVKFIYKNIMTRFGCLVELVSDQGTHFMNKEIQELTIRHMIIHKKSLIDLILQSLIYTDSLWNYYMNKYYSILTKLVNMLITKGSWKVQRYIPGEPKECWHTFGRFVELLKFDLWFSLFH